MDAASGLAENWNLLGFYPLAEISNFMFESLVQVRPAVVKKGKNTQRPYDEAFMTLMLAMTDRGVFALIEYTSHGLHKVGVLTSDGNMRIAVHADSIREPFELPHSSIVDSSARSFAGQLIASLTSTGACAPENTSVQKIREYVKVKAEGVVASEVVESKITAKEAATDLMAALNASIAAIKAEKEGKAA
jgi:non-homologous end joining protein Ku